MKDSDKETLERLAEEAGVSLSSWAREILLAAREGPRVGA